MLQALFDRYCNHVGWLQRDQFIFDPEMKWLAFIDNHNVWTVNPTVWVGAVHGVICMDHDGKVIAWGMGQRIVGDPSLRRKPKFVPMIPPDPTGMLRPMVPNPQLPAAPLMGWSNLSFHEWLSDGLG
jgi:hypothetical protein